MNSEEENLSFYQTGDNNPNIAKGSQANASIISYPKVKNRKEAFRAPKIKELNGHEFIFKYFSSPTYCTFCKEFLWGFGIQGYQCRICECRIHSNCIDLILSNCTSNTNYGFKNAEGININVPHNFKEKRYFKPCLCQHCGQSLTLKHGFKCESCGFNCHINCVKNVPKKCGIDEKKISEILSEIHPEKKKRNPRHLNRPTNSAPLPQMKYSDIEMTPNKLDNIKENIIEEKCTEELEQLMANEIDKLVRNRIKNQSVIYSEPNYDMNRLKQFLESSDDESDPDGVLSDDGGSNESKRKKVTLNNFNLERLVGQGAFGRVFLVTSKSNNKDFYAMKALKKDAVLIKNELESTVLERDVCKLGNKNPFITRLFASFQNDDHLFFLMEFLIGGSLQNHLDTDKRFGEERTRIYAAEILCGIQFLHSECIIHRDLKPDNVLLDSKGHCKITDFGLCRKLENPNERARTFCGTPDYIAGYPPFTGDDDEQLNRAIKEGPIRCSSIFFSDKSKSFVLCLLERDPTKRLGVKTSPFGDVRNHEYFECIDWKKLANCEIEPTFKPKLKSPTDLSNFNRDLIGEKPKLSQMDKKLQKTIDNNIFRGFSFTSKDLRA